MLEYRCSSIAWKPSPISALATSPDESQVAAARDDGSLEIWIVSPGSISWHCQLTIHGDPSSRVSSLAWCRAGLGGPSSGRLFSSSIDGSVSEWDLSDLKQKIVLESLGVSIWQMAVAPSNDYLVSADSNDQSVENDNLSEITDDEEDEGGSKSGEESSLEEFNQKPVHKDKHVALACDDGCVRIYSISDASKLTYNRSLSRVSGRALSVTWSQDAKMIFSGSSDGFIRCWDATRCYEIYRITSGLGGLGSGSELCVWSLLSLRCGTLVSADSTGSVQFWDSKHGTLLQAYSNHKGDVNALAAAPNHDRVFSAGSDGQVILYKLSSEAVVKRWDYISYVRAHTHDIKALTVAVPISREDENFVEGNLKRETRDKRRRKTKDFTYHKWANAGVPMLISAGDDAKLFAYTAQEFTKFSPHDICPAPQRLPIQMVHNTVFNQPCLLVQGAYSLDIQCIQSSNDSSRATTKSLVCVKSKKSNKIICSAISSSGSFFAYSDQIRPTLFELKRDEFGKNPWKIEKRRLPKLPSAHSMVFSSDCSQLLLAGHDRKIYAVNVGSSALVHTFSPSRGGWEDDSQLREPPITKMFTSSEGHWLAAINCFGDIYIFNITKQRQHWFISRLDGACVAAAGFDPRNNNVLVITTSSNQIFVFDVEAKQLLKLSSQQANVLSKMSIEFPGEITGLSFSPSPNSSSVIIYSSRAKCMIDLGMAVGNGPELADGNLSKKLETILLKGGLDFGMSPRKRRFEDYFNESNPIGKKSSEIWVSKHPALFVGHLSKNSILVIEKPWIEVVKSLDTQPVHRHVYGT